MDQINAQYPSLPGLEQAFSSVGSLVPDMATRQFQQADQAQSLNQMFGQQQYNQNEQMNPLLVQGQAATNRHTNAGAGLLEAQTPGAAAESQMKQTAARVDSAIPFDQKLQTAVADLKAKASDSDMKILGNHGQTMAQVGAAALANGGHVPLEMQHMVTPEIAQYLARPGGAQEMVKMGQAFQSASADRAAEREKLKITGDNAARVAGIEAGSREKVEQMGITAGKYLKRWNMSLDSKIDLEGDPVKKYTMLVDAAKQATDPEQQAYYMSRAQQIQNVATAKLAAAQPKPGSVDINQVAGVATNPGLPIAPPNMAPAASAPTENILAKLPPGSKNNGDGTFTLPSGKVVRPKQGQ